MYNDINKGDSCPMVFSSVIFLFYFLPAVLLLYYVAPKKFRNIILLAASLFFYWWGQPDYLILLIASIGINWLTGIIIFKLSRHLTKALALAAGIIINVTLLGIFKYTDFIISTINNIADIGLTPTGIILPIGISFFTFQGMSYLIDIYRGSCSPCFNPLDTALYIALFPQLIAGPIVKYNEIYTKIKERIHSAGLFSSGIKRFIIGLSKKVLIANVLAVTADNIFDAYETGIDIPSAWLGIICYTFQIYFDFSGYSDMAIGLGRMFGFSFAENFNYPYISSSITEFWRRWHISLSTWFRDYIYIPLGGSRSGNRSLNLLLVFLVTGIWHGASFNFVLWGVYYGILLIFEKPLMKSSLYRHIPTAVKWIGTMLIVVLGWVLFRSPSLTSAVGYIGTMFGINAVSASEVHFSYLYYIDNRLLFTLAVACICSIPAWKDIYNNYNKKIITNNNTAALSAIKLIEIPVIFALFIVCIMFIINNVYNPFIYFQF
ncbi:MAG: MBOAT family O-acyltransferase [Floccifex sp.]